jgi:hydrogenase maturation protease
VTDAPAVVIGIGNDYRRDDGVGLAVAAILADTEPSGVRVVTCAAEPTAVLDAWDGSRIAVLVDAAVGAAPGQVRTCSLEELVETSPVSSHDMGLRQTFALARALGRAPDRVAVVSIGVADTGHGIGLSPAVQAALPEAVGAVLRAVGECQEPSDQQP